MTNNSNLENQMEVNLNIDSVQALQLSLLYSLQLYIRTLERSFDTDNTGIDKLKLFLKANGIPENELSKAISRISAAYQGNPVNYNGKLYPVAVCIRYAHPSKVGVKERLTEDGILYTEINLDMRKIREALLCRNSDALLCIQKLKLKYPTYGKGCIIENWREEKLSKSDLEYWIKTPEEYILVEIKNPKNFNIEKAFRDLEEKVPYGYRITGILIRKKEIGVLLENKKLEESRLYNLIRKILRAGPKVSINYRQVSTQQGEREELQ